MTYTLFLESNVYLHNFFSFLVSYINFDNCIIFICFHSYLQIFFNYICECKVTQARYPVNPRGATALWRPEPANRLLASRPLVLSTVLTYSHEWLKSGSLFVESSMSCEDWWRVLGPRVQPRNLHFPKNENWTRALNTISLNCCLSSTDAIHMREKFMHAYKGSRSTHASAFHWNPPGFRKKK